MHFTMRYPVWIDVYILFLEFFDEAKTQNYFVNLSAEEAQTPEHNVESEACEATPEAVAELDADVATASNVEVRIL